MASMDSKQGGIYGKQGGYYSKQGQSSHDTVKGDDYFGVGDIPKKAIKVIPEVLPPLVGCIKNC